MITPENIVDAKLGGASKEEIQALQQNIGKPSSQERIIEVTRSLEELLLSKNKAYGKLSTESYQCIQQSQCG